MGSLLTGGALHHWLSIATSTPTRTVHQLHCTIGFLGLSLMTPVRVVTVRQESLFSICILVLELCKVHLPAPPLLLHPSPLHPSHPHNQKMHLVMLRSPSYYGSCGPAWTPEHDPNGPTKHFGSIHPPVNCRLRPLTNFSPLTRARRTATQFGNLWMLFLVTFYRSKTVTWCVNPPNKVT